MLEVVIGDPPLSQGCKFIGGESGDKVREECERIGVAMIEEISAGLVVQRGGSGRW